MITLEIPLGWLDPKKVRYLIRPGVTKIVINGDPHTIMTTTLYGASGGYELEAYSEAEMELRRIPFLEAEISQLRAELAAKEDNHGE